MKLVLGRCIALLTAIAGPAPAPVLFCVLLLSAQSVCAQAVAPQGLAPRADVVFATTQTTTSGQSIYVLGDLPELGANDITRAIKLTPSAYPIWRATISLPAGRTYSYRFVRRSDGPGQTSLASNGVFLTAAVSAAVPAQPMLTQSKAVFLTWNIQSPAIFARAVGSAGAFARTNMRVLGPAVAGRTGELQHVATLPVAAGLNFEFYFTAADGTSSRYPFSGTYSTTFDGVFVQDGQLYSYIPAAVVTAAQRGYNPAAVPAIFSPELNETRGYRVYLPRGYAQHTTRRYPVLYMHDGQNVFESGAFGSWNAAGTLTQLQAQGKLREVLVVALDNGPSRLTDYLPPTDVLTGLGRGDRYLAYVRDRVKPFIDTTYRTLPDAENTGLLGSSMGGVISLYGIWDFRATFSRGGLMSGAWQTCPNYLNQVRAGSPRNVRMWLDSGDAGSANDNYWPTLNLRDFFVGATAAGSPGNYALSGTIQHLIGYGQQHNEAAWTQRLGPALSFLFPPEQEPNALLQSVFSPHWDRTGDGTLTVDDLYAQTADPIDLNLDAALSEADAAVLERSIRQQTLAEGMSAAR